MESVEVNLGKNGYEIIVGESILPQLGKVISKLGKFNKVAIVTDVNVADLYLECTEHTFFTQGYLVSALRIPDGEKTKNWQNLEIVVEWILENKIDRDDLIVALGGGVLGDLVGFAASILRRGLPYIQVPTTLLAQVDSSVGGKTAINSNFGKNLIGTFFQPKLVFADTQTLLTLNTRQFLAGLSEVIKYGLIRDKNFFEWIECNLHAIANREAETLSKLIIWSCKIKAEVVKNDEKENGERALLNLGHTFGHALESFCGYSDKLLHGEAVSIGTVIAFQFANSLGICSSKDTDRLLALYKKLGMKYHMDHMEVKLPEVKVLVDFMKQDKKVKNGRLVFILPRSIGHCNIMDDISSQSLYKFLESKCL